MDAVRPVVRWLVSPNVSYCLLNHSEITNAHKSLNEGSFLNHMNCFCHPWGGIEPPYHIFGDRYCDTLLRVDLYDRVVIVTLTTDHRRILLAGGNLSDHVDLPMGVLSGQRL